MHVGVGQNLITRRRRIKQWIVSIVQGRICSDDIMVLCFERNFFSFCEIQDYDKFGDLKMTKFTHATKIGKPHITLSS